MQQLRERAAKIVQHLTVEQVSQSDGLDLIRRTIEASPIVKLLDQKRVDRRRQKFMKLSRLAGESLESFLNRADIYRRENQASPAYQVGEQFYLGHLLDAAKLTKRDLALIKAAAGGALEDETAVTFAMLELADQLEGVQGFPIGRGEPQIDHEDKYLVQKATSAANTSSSPASTAFAPRRSKGRGRGFPRRRLRDALVAILEDDEQDGEDPVDIADEDVGTLLGEESCDEEEPDITAFAPVSADTSTPTTADPPPFAEIYAQEYKARNRVRQIKKMRQYFQKEGPQAGRRRDPNVQKWVEEQQKTEPCFICRQLGHWSQECPYRGQAPTRAANVVHSANVSFQHFGQSDQADWDFLMGCAKADEQYKGANGTQYACHMVSPNHPSNTTNEVFWSMAELGNKMILDLGCMRTVAGTLWATPVVKEWRRRGRYVKVIPEKESFRFGDGHICESKVALIIQVTLASIPCLLRLSVLSGKCPPLLSKPVATKLGLLIDTENHTVASRMYHVKAFGLGMAVNGHYLLDIHDNDVTSPQIPGDFRMPSDVEVYPLSQSGSKQVVNNPTAKTATAATHAIRSAHGDGREPMGDSGPGRRGVQHDRRGGSAEIYRSISGEFAEVQDQEADYEGVQTAEVYSSVLSRHSRGSEGDAGADGPYAANVLADEGDDGAAEGSHAARNRGSRERGDPQQGEAEGRQQCEQGRQQRSQEDSSTAAICGTDWPRSSISHVVDDVQRRPDVEHHPEHQVPVRHLQVEDAVADDEDQARCGARDGQGQGHQEALETQSSLDHVDARQALGSSMGPLGLGTAAVQQSKDMVAGSVRNRARTRTQEEGLLEPSDPNAPTDRELARRAFERPSRW